MTTPGTPGVTENLCLAGFELNGEAVSDFNGGPVARGDADRAPPPAVVADAQYSCSFGPHD